MPQSTVSTRPYPSSREARERVAGDAVALLEAARQVPARRRRRARAGRAPRARSRRSRRRRSRRGRRSACRPSIAARIRSQASRHVAEQERVVPGRLAREERRRGGRAPRSRGGRAREAVVSLSPSSSASAATCRVVARSGSSRWPRPWTSDGTRATGRHRPRCQTPSRKCDERPQAPEVARPTVCAEPDRTRPGVRHRS